MFTREQLIDFLQAIASSISSGLGMRQAFSIAAEVSEGPLQKAGKLVATSQPDSQDLALCDFANTLSCGPIHRTVKHLLMASRVGSSVSEILMQIIGDVRQLPTGSMVTREEITPLVPLIFSLDAVANNNEFQISEGTRELLRNLKKDSGQEWDAAKLSCLQDMVNFPGGFPEGRSERVKFIRSSLEVLAQNGFRVLFCKEIIDLAFGFGPLEDLLIDPNVTTITVEGTSPIRVTMKGATVETALRFTDERQLMNVMERMISPEFKRLDEKNPVLTTRLRNGNCLTLVLPPISRVPLLHLQKALLKVRDFSELIKEGAMTESLAKEIRGALIERNNIVVCGPDQMLRAELMSALVMELKDKSVVIIEGDGPGVTVEREGVIRLFTRPPNIEGEGEIAAKELFDAGKTLGTDYIVFSDPDVDRVSLLLRQRSGLILGLAARDGTCAVSPAQSQTADVLLEIRQGPKGRTTITRKVTD